MKTDEFDNINKALGKSLKEIMKEQKSDAVKKLIKSEK